MSVRRIIETFETWRASGAPIVLATVYETIGSTYSKAGHRILIAANGDYQGLVSGGCLEGDVAERARRVADTGEAAAVTYDLRDDADDPWGLGVGCNGLIRVFLQPLYAATGYEPFASIAQQLVAPEAAAVATVVAGGQAFDSVSAERGAAAHHPLTPGATLIFRPAAPARSFGWRLDAERRGAPFVERLFRGCARAIAAGRAHYETVDSGSGVLYAPLHSVPRLLVLGAGLDAVPVVNMAADLGWFVTVADHRPGYLARGGFSRADRVLEVDPRRLGEQVLLDELDAILVMSHHLVTDRIYLSQLADVGARYLGVLGPPARRARLLEALGDVGEALRPRLRGPVGLDIGADSPESIALSIVAELQSVFAASERSRQPA